MNDIKRKEDYSDQELKDILIDFKDLQVHLLNTKPLKSGRPYQQISEEAKARRNIFASFSLVVPEYWESEIANSYSGCKDEIETVIDSVNLEIYKRSKK